MFVSWFITFVGLSKSYKIAVIGSGPTGASTALFLNQKGFDVTVFEKKVIPKPIGAGFMLQPTGMLMLQKLGLLDKIAKRATPINRLYGVNENNKEVLDLRFDYLKNFKHSLGIHRGLIFKVLHEELNKKSISLKVGNEITSFRKTSDKIIPINSDNEKLGEFDLLVIADGSRSKLRDKTSVKFKKHWYDWLAMWYVLEDTDFKMGNKIYHKYEKTKKLLGFMPIGFGPDKTNDKRLVNLFYSVPETRLNEIKNGTLGKWKEEVCKLDKIGEHYLNQIQSMDDFTYTGYGRMKPSRMYDDKIAIVGDAAHGMSPQLGQGISMGLLDGCSLANSIDECDNVENGLVSFSKDRMSHLKYYLWADSMSAPLFQSHQFHQSYMRDIGFPLLKSIPFTYKLFLETMIGVKTGLFSKNIKVDTSLIY